MENRSEENYYFYILYGLKIKSEIRIDELISIDSHEDYDVLIRYGEMPKDIKDAINDKKHSYLSKEDSWFKVDNVAIYEIKDGKEIIVYKLCDDLKEIKAFLLGTSFGILLMQRDIVTIHGGSVDVNNKVYIFTGESGAGKSTLVAGCKLKGYKFLADDVSALSLENNNIYVNPAYPQQKICDDALEELAIDSSNLNMFDIERKKYAVPDKKSFISNKKEVYGIIEILPKDDIKEVALKEITGIEKMNFILRNIYRVECARVIGIKDDYLNNIIKISSKLRIFTLERPKNEFTINEQIEKIVMI